MPVAPLPYLVVIADVIASRELPDRAAAQRRLRASLDSRNAARAPGELLSPYTLTLGDEFQVVPARAAGLFGDLLQVAADLAPVALRFALALGDIDTAINPQQAIGMDGSAFHRARDGITRLKDAAAHCRVEGLSGVHAALVNEGLALAFGRLAGARGSRLPLTVGLLADRPIADIAARLDRTEQTLYKTARAADLYALVGFLRAVEALLDEQLGAASAGGAPDYG
ncbi:SatD family protein [uncultured Thiohalocapsa sp.]|uniref:SatD family protein n=1 Tax=uncultured Thiohalocapsa sp. TaxID=768990 RepID=UPI0025D1423E|nr:SatD family protein [uncultured Thiohalocapsa sp.]